MRLFYYVHTGHRIGLDRFRRAATIIRALGDVDITLLTSDYRIAQVSHQFGIKRAVGVDVVRNIPQISHHGDQIIFDSDELNATLHADMASYFSTFIRVTDDINATKLDSELLISPYLEGEGIHKNIIVDPHFFVRQEKTIEITFFFGDDDYEEDLLKNIDMLEGLTLELLTGFYFFMDYEDKIAPAFTKIHEFEDYDNVIKSSKVLITASPQAALEHLAAGGQPIYLQRPDYTREFLPLFKTLNIPYVDGYNRENLLSRLEELISHKCHSLEENIEKTADFLKSSLSL